ncbi:MAG: hypothetical protein FJ319_00690 [SAR202 cluster bacterium]|nr:hypothetical protein [SAR202 cluster bacterium]
MRPQAQLLYFRSKIDLKLHPYAVCATDDLPGPKPLILEISPGAITNLQKAVEDTEKIADIARRGGKSCVVLRPTGCGPGSVHQNYGEVDVFEAIEAVAASHEIDRDRITVIGSSMGGASVWYMVSHYPDFFAAGVPICGYCDYRLWEKPGGATFHMSEWEEPSWQARSAALLVENLEHTPLWIELGAWDRGVGGGVPVEHSRQMSRLLREKGFQHQYTETAKLGHEVPPNPMYEQLILWMLEQNKVRNPRHVALATYQLRHNRSYWVTVDQIERYGRRALVNARLEDGGAVTVSTANVRGFSIGPVGSGRGRVAVDGQDMGVLEISKRLTFRINGKSWSVSTAGTPGEKRRGMSGPISDLFFDRALMVPGTAGTDEETHFNTWAAKDAQAYFKKRNGGVHRGGIMGENSVDLAIVPDKELADDDLKANNILLYGTYATNAVLARFKGKLPLEFGAGAITLAGKRYTGERLSVFALFPHPLNGERYVAVHGGVTPDAVCWGSHLGMMLLPDYIVYDGGRMVDWGFWGNEWR